MPDEGNAMIYAVKDDHQTMKVLFVSSGGKSSVISPIVKNQAESLLSAGVEINYFLVKGRGLKGYLNSIIPLKREIKKLKPAIIHAHYGLCCLVATLSTRKPIVASLMGSDIEVNPILLKLFQILSRYRWMATIIKSKGMNEKLRFENAYIIPNGVNLNTLKPKDQKECKKKAGFDTTKKQILFIADPDRKEKNYSLAVEAFNIANMASDSNLELILIHNVDFQTVINYINAADVLLLTSKREGSPNIIKEAMACNCPIVTTNVGDVEWVIGDTCGCYITSFDPKEIAEKIILSVDFENKTNGRQRIIDIGLASETIAQKILNIYALVEN